MIRILRAKKSNNSIKSKMNVLFVDSFYDYFSSFCKDKKKLYRCFKGSFIINKFYLVLLDNRELIGMGACGDGSSTIKLSKRKFLFNLGFRLGSRIYKYLKIIFEERDYAFEMDKRCGMIEFVCVNEDYRNKKVGYILVNHMIRDNTYLRYLAKVGDNNYCMRNILDNIGFEEFDIEQSKIKEKEDVGVENYLYMICENFKLKQ